MGIYLNPGNSGFAGIRNDTYVDQSGLIVLINETIDTPRRLTCVSRPCRFGKSFAAKMLCAYYDKTCDSSALFDKLTIAGDKKNDGAYRQHLNRYDVIYLDMTMIIDEWDAPIRENPFVQQEYLEFLRTLFKSSQTTAKIFAAAYITGILPIKKDGRQSAISDFKEFSMIKPDRKVSGISNSPQIICTDYLRAVL